MRHIIWVICLLCTSLIARGQTNYEYVYWFDGDYASRKMASSDTTKLTLQADVSELSETLHTLHLQVRSASGVWSTPLTRMFVNMRKTDTREGWYWFDDENKAREKQNISGLFDVDVSMLDNGLHTIHYMAVDAKGNTASPVSRTFLKIAEKGEELTYRCWFDNKNDSIFTGTITDNLFWLDVSSLEDGLHTVHVQVLNHLESSPLTYQFLKTPQIIGVEYLTCLCYIDGKLYHQERVSSSDGVVNWNLDVSALKQGMHTIQVQIVTPSGVASSLCEGMFIRSTTGKEMASLKCFYTIDNAESRIEAGSYADGTFHFDLDVASLTDGLHQLTYMLLGDNGVSTKISSSFFVKTPVGGNGIAHYEYWLNDDEAHKTVVELEKRTNPLQLIGLLPVESVPIRSSCFHFEVDEEKGPMLYAKNEFHIRFFDATGRLTDATKPYLDYNVGEKVEDTVEIKKTQTFARPEENTIKWFTLQACEGDTIAFRSSQALSLQVFSPSGEEIYRTSEAESVKWGGCHTWENGTYYVAVHDVTSSRPDVTLEYMHMDKYDVVDQDVKTVGNGGCSTITFQGNGFKDLYAVDLYNAQGDTIDAKAIHHESDATVNVTFDFTDKTISKYDAVFHFTTEDRKFADMLTVEEAKDITLDLNVQYPSTFLRGTSVTYTISVTNNGNSTAYDVPLELRLRSGGAFSEIESVRFTDDEGKEFNNITLEDMNLDLDSLGEETVAFLDEEIDMLNGGQTFFIVSDSIANDEFGYADLHLTVAPHETSVFHVTLKSRSSVKLEATIPTEWITINTRDYNEQRSNGVQRSPSQDGFCCYKEAVECTIEVVVNLVGFLPVSGCIGLLDHYAYTAIEIACSDGHSLGDKERNFYGSMAEDAEKYKSYIKRGVSTIVGCALGRLLAKYVEPLIKKLKILKDQLKNFEDKIKDSQRLRKLNLDLAEDATKQQMYYNKKNLEYSEEAARRLNDGDKVGAKEMYDAAAKAKEEADSYAALASKYKNKVSSLDDEILAIQKKIEEILNNIKQLRLEEIAAKERIRNLLDNIKTGIDAYTGRAECKKIWDKTVPNCPPKPKGGGGSSTPVNSYDPNEIYGYLSPSGSTFIAKDSVEAVDYRIEFENDTAFATSAAHVVEIIDTLDADFFELSTFEPTYFNIGNKREQLDGTPNFVRTVDMRPEINVIVQVEGQYDEKKGIARWLFTSLDPMTMEPTDDVMQGFLPVNHDGASGIGDVGYRIGVKKGLEDGLEITNRASIVFDANEPILTPTWTNIVDGVCPGSTITEIAYKNDSIVTLNIEGNDERSGVWKYDLYVQYGVGSPWMKEGELSADSTQVDYKVHDGLYYGFCVLATDSAGNMEQKELRPEVMCADIHLGDVNSDGEVNSLDASLVMAYYLEEPVSLLLAAADVNEDGEVNTLDATLIIQMYLNSEQKKESAPKLKQLFKIQK